MVRLQLILRSITSVNKSKTLLNYNGLRFSSSKSTGSDSDSEKKVVEKKDVKQKKETLDKLSLLLKQMVEDGTSTKSKLNLARPSDKRTSKKDPKTLPKKVETIEKQMETAAKDVAESIGGNTKQTEFDLLSKLLNSNEQNESVAINLSEIVKGMKIDRESKASESRAQQVKQIMVTNRQQRQMGDEQFSKMPRRTQVQKLQAVENLESVNIFSAEPLGLFTSPIEEYEVRENKVWKMLQERENRLAVTHPPTNYFQEMILWTEQGKIWKFPIDNEQGMEAESSVEFSEHVFMDQHLEPWCPPKGPIRHFMELVCVGLSKNSYMTVKEKKEHIEWYRGYFEDKKQLLREVGAITSDAFTERQIEAK